MNTFDNWPHDNVYKEDSHPEPNSNAYSNFFKPVTSSKSSVESFPRKNKTDLKIFKLLGIVSLLGIGVGVAGGFAFNYSNNTDSINHSITIQTAENAILPDSIEAVAAQIQPGVVHINAAGEDDFSSGSGFIITDTGYVITNHHVIQSSLDEGVVEVVLENGDELVGEIVGSNQGYDIAVVKLPSGPSYTTLPIGDSDSLNVGETVIAAGSPLGLQGTVTQGIVSATSRPVVAGGGDAVSFVNAIQTDAAINPGNSGGPLVNTAGAVVGVNSAIVTTSQDAGSIGLGFAIPVKTAMRIFEEIVQTGKSKTPTLGVNLDVRYQGDGVKIEAVSEGSPAEESGLLPNDIVTRIDGIIVKTPTDLIVKVRDKTPGDIAFLEILRNGVTLELEVATVGKEE